MNSEYEEIAISLPGGTIAGKWWGPKHIRPILCLHGWQDNAGTFDTLIPLLPKHVSYLAIDLPGHGLSFRYPSGIVYNFHDFTFIIRLIADLYKWNKVSFLSHSMGVFATFLYAGLFPDEVDFVVALDALQPFSKYFDAMSTTMRRNIVDNVNFEKLMASDEEPPTYTYDEIVQKTIEGSADSVTAKVAPYLLKRGMAQSTRDPSKYYFTRDIRVKHGLIRINDVDYNIHLANFMKMPYLYIKAKDSPYFGPKHSHDETLKALQKTNPNFRFKFIEGNHHVHLTHPERINGFISDIILKTRPICSGAEHTNYHINCKL